MIYSGVIHKVWIDTSLSQMVFFLYTGGNELKFNEEKEPKGSTAAAGV